MSCNIIACFIMVPFTLKILFYSLLLNLECAKTAINYSRFSVFRTDVICVIFRSTDNMRSNHILIVVYSRTIVKKKNILLYWFLVFRNPLQWCKTSRCSSDSKLSFFPNLYFSKGSGVIQHLSDTMNKVTNTVVSRYR